MSPQRKRVLLIIGGALGFLVLLAWLVPFFVNVDQYKSRLEVAASEALGMSVRVDGRLGMGFFPGTHLTLEGGRILGEQGETVATVKKATLYVDLLPLLRSEVRLHRVDLAQPSLFIERDSTEAYNVAKLKKAASLLETLDGGSVTVKNGILRCVDQRSGQTLEAAGIRLAVRRIRFERVKGPAPMKRLSFQAQARCAQVRTKAFAASAVRMKVEAREGIIEFDPVTMEIFGGQGTATMRADVTDSVPRFQVRYLLLKFRIEEFLKVLSPTKAGEGEMAFSMNLSMQGDRWSRLVETAEGEVSLRGHDLTLFGHDIDGAISRFESSQNFSLVDVGAVVLAGPLGLAVTKGYNFASLFKGTEGTSKIGTVVSDWKIERGVAQSKDVAMATEQNRLAVQGGLDFVTGTFADVTLAVVDADGCPSLRQTIRGPFEKPEVEKPKALSALAGPIVEVLKKAKDLLPGPCEVFYSGSVAPPKGK